MTTKSFLESIQLADCFLKVNIGVLLECLLVAKATKRLRNQMILAGIDRPIASNSSALKQSANSTTHVFKLQLTSQFYLKRKEVGPKGVNHSRSNAISWKFSVAKNNRY